MARVAALLGDLVGSRSSRDRQGLHDNLAQALSDVSAELPGLGPLAVTAGDEFQGTYASLGEALASAFAVRVRLSPAIDVRFGVGRGDVTVLDPTAGTQDGPAWWSARAAIDAVEAAEQETGWSALRTAYRSAQGEDSLQEAVNAALVCQDLLVDSWDIRSWSIVRGIMQGRTQSDIADELGISRQAVQQRRRSAGLPMVLAAAEGLAGLP
ncbi:MAG: SatD family protein [Ornithinimicrobium sp.]